MVSSTVLTPFPIIGHSDLILRQSKREASHWPAWGHLITERPELEVLKSRLGIVACTCPARPPHSACTAKGILRRPRIRATRKMIVQIIVTIEYNTHSQKITSLSASFQSIPGISSSGHGTFANLFHPSSSLASQHADQSILLCVSF